MKAGPVGYAATVGASLGGGVLGGALLGTAEAAWIAAHSATHVAPGLFGFAILLYGGAGAIWGAGLGIAVATVRKLMGRSEGTRGAFFTVACGLIVVFMGFPVAKFLIGRDVYMERLAWSSPTGLGIQAATLVSLCALFFFMTAGVSRVLDRLPHWVSGPIATPVLLAAAGVVLMLLPAGGLESEPRKGDRPGGPNIVLVMVDTLRADVTDPYGGPGLTPNLGRLARRGVTFTNARANSSWTRPSVATVMSGRYPSSHGAMFKMDGLPDGVDTIAEQLSASGYATKGIVSNYVTAPYFNFGQGFDSYTYLEPSYFFGANDVTSKLNLYELMRKLDQKLFPGSIKPNAQYREGSQVTDAALSWLSGWESRARKGDRYFLFVQYMDPHDPYFSHPDDGAAPSRKSMPSPPAAMKDRMWSLYKGEVRYWDEHFGRLLDGLVKSPSFEDTLIVVFADHGEEFLEHGGWWHGDTMYDEAIRVPLVIRLSGDEAGGQEVADLVSLVDVAPTLVRLGGGVVPEGYQGQDLFETHLSPVFGEEQHVGNDLQSLVYRRQGGNVFKVIACNEKNPRGLPARSLFDLTADPAEKQNLSASQPEELQLALSMLVAAMKTAAQGAVAGKSVQIDEASQHRLKELGYIHDDEK